MTVDRMKVSLQTVKDNIAIMESNEEPDDAGYYLQLEHEKFVAKAIEKQIPKKPKFYDTKFRQRWRKYGEYVTIEKAYDCPNCNCTVWGTDKDKYCGNCGQALDWSDTE